MLTGCSSDDDDDAGEVESTAPVVQLGGPGETNRVLTDDEVDDLESPGYTDADVAFVHGMIAHHEQALAMTALVAGPRRARRPRPARRADRQSASATRSPRWRRGSTERGEAVPRGRAHIAHAELMPGMLTAEEFAQLEGASGASSTACSCSP